jgi:hypothetical protein
MTGASDGITRKPSFQRRLVARNATADAFRRWPGSKFQNDVAAISYELAIGPLRLGSYSKSSNPIPFLSVYECRRRDHA